MSTSGSYALPVAPPLGRVRDEQIQSASTRVIVANMGNPSEDLAAERARASFDVATMCDVLYGPDLASERRRMAAHLAGDPRFSKVGRYFMTREQRMARSLQMAADIPLAFIELGLRQEYLFMFVGMLDEPLPTALHWGMFVPTIRGQATEEQKEEWLPLAMEMKTVGTYAQTELGHGTFLRGLETTATFDPDTDEFIVHSPTLTSTKWWPGGLGKTATHAVVMARLFTNGVDHGPHPFYVQLRSLDDHAPLPGISVGSIGPKLGYMTADNGYLRFDHVRIKRMQMLMRYATVSKNGVYDKPSGKTKTAYGTMIFVRASIVKGAYFRLSKACTIAVRYNAVRRQTSVRPGGLEKQVLDYQNSMYTLLPLLAISVSLRITGDVMGELYAKFERSTQKQDGSADFSGLAALHYSSSGLKALTTELTADAIERCRRCCGGHGYSKASGLPTTLTDYLPSVTYEGENNVMFLQTARFLLKSVAAAKRGDVLASAVAHLGALAQCDDAAAVLPAVAPLDLGANPREVLRRPSTLVGLFEVRAASLAAIASARMDGLMRGGVSEGDARNSCAQRLIFAARAHCQLILLRDFEAFLSQQSGGSGRGGGVNELAVLAKLFAVMALYLIEVHLGDFLTSGCLTPHSALSVGVELDALLCELRPDAVAIVDSFDHSDYALDSALGRFDGNVYQDLYDRLASDPVNRSELPPGYETHLKPLIKGGIWSRSKL